MLAWHFLRPDRRLQFPPHTLVEPLQTLEVEGPIKLCQRGLHASKRIIDALQYAPGPIVCRVDLGGEILEENDKYVASFRKCLWMLDATRILHEFSCRCAEEAMQHIERSGATVPKKSRDAIAAKRLWIDGKITDLELEAASAAAREAAWSAAYAACSASSAACSAAYAACSAGDAAASAAADAAAWAAAWAAAREAARDDQNSILESMVMNSSLNKE